MHCKMIFKTLHASMVVPLHNCENKNIFSDIDKCPLSTVDANKCLANCFASRHSKLEAPNAGGQCPFCSMIIIMRFHHI